MADYKVLKDVVGSSLLYGNTVYFTESGDAVPYVLVSEGNNNNYLFMRKYAPSDKVEFFAEAADWGTKDSERIYEGHTLDKFMSGTFYSRFSTDWQKIFVTQKIVVTSASTGYGYYIYRKVFAPSATELGLPKTDSGTIPQEGTAFKYFTSNAGSKRQCRLEDSSGDYVEYSTRSKNNQEGNVANYYCVTVGPDSGEYDSDVWQKWARYCRPVLSINKNVSIIKETAGWRIIPNLPPDAPSSTWRIFTLNNGESIDLSWSSSSDGDSTSVPNYRLQRMIDSGEWVTILETSDTSYSKVLGYKEAESTLKYRVQAFDEYNNSTDWTMLATITVVNNIPPSAPSYISVNGKYKGEQIVVTWGEATDEDMNLKGYKLYRSVNGSAYSQIYESSTTVYRDTAGDWDTVKYKVVAYDESGAVSEGKEASINLLTRITMSVVVSENSDFVDGKVFSFTSEDTENDLRLNFTVEDSVSDDVYIVVANIDNSLLINEESDVSKGKFSFAITTEMWQKIMNGEHTINISVYNSEGFSVSESLSFVKKTNGVFLTLKNPVVVGSSDVVSKFLVNVTGSFPEGSTLEVKVTNNANDDSPVWQTVSKNEINTNEFVEFSNKTAVNGSAFNIIVKADRVTATDECYISSVNGMFGRNIFEYIFERLDALEAGAANV